MYLKVYRETGSDDIFALLGKVNGDLEDDTDNLMNNLDTKFLLEEMLENELDSDDEPLNLLVPEANYHVVENPTIKVNFEEGSRKAEKEIKRKSKEKRQGKEKGKGKGKGKEKKQGKYKIKKKSNLVKLNLIWEKYMLHMQRNNVVRRLTLSM